MSLVSIDAQNASLDNDYGASTGPAAAAAHQVALFVGDPLAGGTELTSDGGYVRPVVTNNGTNWPGATSGATTSVTIAFDASTDAWSGIPTHWLLYDDADGTTAWDSGELDPTAPISVDVADVVVEVTLTVYYAGGTP
jgi:hypothetical protein